MSKRDDILKATLNLIIKGGFQSLTLATILNEANAGYGTLYNHFKSKDELIYVLYCDLRKKISHVVLADFNENHTIKQQFDHFVEKYLDFCINNIDEMNFVEQFSYFYSDSATIVGLDDDGFYKALYTLLDTGQKNGLLKKCKIELLIQSINGSVMSLARGVNSGKYRLSDKDKLDYLQICWDSIKD
ncbi:TetR/AcrR family transcriptional regulator [Cytobacillus sp. IB215316]|uniref:TetR/AcrR family transcriptional regulator n=1 Tax=Cytobacillus sp. IB215316 TaxID=3097354 RepID=UPI002A159F9D|nr:TetR/AcrR family transcriptional regulator [Cytobacillus sp. IB215316]MDX8363493.1 TetR/AcrR family transcriptional regulator [Cytobacillus sp. IB215316]